MFYLSFISTFLWVLMNFTPTSTLQIEVQNIENTKGMIAVALYNSKDTFCKDDDFIIAKRYAIEKVGTLLIEIPEVTHGNYAIAVYHDINDDKTLNKSIFGIPKESYGFSNEINPKWTPPNFDDAKFDFNENTSKQKIVLKYWKD